MKLGQFPTILDTYRELSLIPSLPRKKKSRISGSDDEDWIPATAYYLPG
jgi:hypothetical protein